MSLRYLELADFRIFHSAHIEPEPEGTTVITGPNGTGKTSVLEALAYLGTRRSFRGAPPEAMVRTGATSAIVRAEIAGADSPTLVEAEILPAGRSRTRVNRKSVHSRKDLAAAAPCTIFSPEDLVIISGGPKGRRDLLDDALALLDPEGARAADETERVLRQRAALLRQSGGRAGGDVGVTLDVWDQRLADAGKVLVEAREPWREISNPWSGRPTADWRVPAARCWCSSATSGAGTATCSMPCPPAASTTCGVGSTRSDPTATTCTWPLTVVRPGRTPPRENNAASRSPSASASTRSSAPGRRWSPTLLLDDVFSELDPARSKALVAELPPGQSILTTAAPLPEGIDVARIVAVESLEAA